MSSEVSSTVKAMAIEQPAAFGPCGAYAQAYALYNMSYAGAMIVGPLWAGFIKESQGWSTMCWSLGILSAVSAVSTVSILRYLGYLWMMAHSGSSPKVLFTGGFLFKKQSISSQEVP